MKKIVLSTLFLLGFGLAETFAQNYNNWAIGARVGEPLGLNLRKYFAGGSKSFDVNVGTYGLLWGGTRKYNGDYYYEGSTGLMVQGIHFWNKPLGIQERWQVYYGFGGQINSRKRPLVTGNRVANKDLSIGVVGSAGIEHRLPNNNLSIFLDGGLYFELIKKPLFTAVPASIGVRINIGG